jgi:acetyl-CoA C-acetyltransferase
VVRELDLDPDIVNVNGGAIALGHPVGATGLVLVTKALSEMSRRDIQYGIVTMCVGNGQGMAVLLELAQEQ